MLRQPGTPVRPVQRRDVKLPLRGLGIPGVKHDMVPPLFVLHDAVVPWPTQFTRLGSKHHRAFLSFPPRPQRVRGDRVTHPVSLVRPRAARVEQVVGWPQKLDGFK